MHNYGTEIKIIEIERLFIIKVLIKVLETVNAVIKYIPVCYYNIHTIFTMLKI